MHRQWNKLQRFKGMLWIFIYIFFLDFLQILHIAVQWCIYIACSGHF